MPEPSAPRPESYWDKLKEAAKLVLARKASNLAFPGFTAAHDVGNTIGNLAADYAQSRPEAQRFSDGAPAFTNAFGPTSIPGLRPAEVNGESVSEVDLRARVAADKYGKELAAKYPELSDKARAAGAAIQRLKETASSGKYGPTIDHIVDPSSAPETPAQKLARSEEVLEANRRAIAAQEYVNELGDIESMRKRLPK